MKRFAASLCLILFLASAGKSSAGFSEPICGFLPGLRFYEEADEVTQGLAVELSNGEAQLNRPAPMRFLVRRKPGNVPQGNLELEQGALMRVIGVRDDLSEFFLLHPAKAGSAVWETTHTFSRGGSYKVWAEVKWRGSSYAFGQKPFQISGEPGPAESFPPATNWATNAGYAVNLSYSGPLTTGATNRLEFSIRDQAGNTVATEDYLGAPMHLFIFRKDLRVYLHALPGNPASPAADRFRRAVKTQPETAAALTRETVIRFGQVFPKPGAYKLIARFRPRNSKLPADQSVQVEFYVNVVEER